MCLILSLLGLSPEANGATTLGADSNWTQFRWFGDGGSFESLDGPYTFTVPSGQVGIVDVTDAFEIGDRFTLTDGGTLLGVTPSASGSGFTRDADVAFASSMWSSATFELPAGSHSIQLETTTIANGQTLGGAFIRLRFEELNDLTWETPGSLTYGTPLSATQLDAAVSSGLSGSLAYDPPDGSVLSAGNQLLTVTFTPSDSNATPLTATVTIQVVKAPLTLSINSANRAFGQANPTFSFSYSGFVGNDSDADLTATPTVTTTATAQSPPGTYPITATGTFDPNYSISVVQSTLTITNDSNLVVEWPQPDAITYGTPLSTAQLNATIVDGTSGTFSYQPPIGSVLGAGTHSLNLTFTPSSPEIAPIGASQTLTINRAPLTIRADDRVASLAQVPLPLAFVLVDNPGNASSSGGYGAVSNSFEIGQFEVTNSLYTDFLNAIGKNDPVSNSQFSTHPPLFNTEMDRVARGGIRRFGSAPNFSYQVKPGMGNKPIIYTSFWDACRFCNWLHNGRPNGEQIASTTEDGVYDLTNATAVANNTVTRKPGARFFIPNEDEWFKAAFHNPNAPGGYHSYSTGSIVQPIAALADSQGNATNSGPNVANYGRNADWDSNQNGTIETAQVNGSIGPEDGNVMSVGSTGSTSHYGATEMAGNVGEWTETAIGSWGRFARGGSWNGSEAFLNSSYRFPAGFAEEVNARGFRVARPTGSNTEWVLPSLTLSYFGLVNGDTPQSIGSTPTVTTTANPVSGIGTYPINVSGGFASNYLISFESGNLLLNNKTNPSITWSTPASIAYGTALGSSQLNASSGGIPGSYTFEPSLGTVLDAGTHTLIATFQPTDANTYNPVTTKVSLLVTPAALIISADDITLTAPEFTLTATHQGLVNGDTLADLYVPVTLTTEATEPITPGTYTITASNASSPNYSIIHVPGTLTRAEPTQPTITWETPAPISYGTSLTVAQLKATLSASIAGTFVYTPPIGSLLEPSNSSALEVVFTPENTFNYTDSSATVSLVVNKAPLTITIANAQRAAGVANPTLSASYAGFVLGETTSDLNNPLVLATTATVESAPGSYPITGTQGDDARYAITIVSGSLSIAAKGIPTPNWAPPSGLTYGQALTSTELNAATTEGIPGQWIYTPPLTTVLDAGTQTLSASFTPANPFAHEATTASVSLEVSPAPLTIRARDQERPFGEENPTLGFDYVGFVNGDTSATIEQRPSTTTVANADSDPGTYPIVLAGASDTNYTITQIDGTLTVTEIDVLPLPELTLLRDGTQITLSWPERDDIGLEQTDALLEWNLISTDIDLSEGNASWIYQLPEDAATAPQQFYRLTRLPRPDDIQN